jgi:hypothetical protein
MSEYVQLLQSCIEDAPHDQRAESLLRSIVQSVAGTISSNDLTELGMAVLRIHRAEGRRLLESN